MRLAHGKLGRLPVLPALLMMLGQVIACLVPQGFATFLKSVSGVWSAKLGSGQLGHQQGGNQAKHS